MNYENAHTIINPQFKSSIITRSIRTYHVADINSDHELVLCNPSFTF